MPIARFLNTPLGSALKVFTAVMLTMIVADWTNHGRIDFESWQTWVIAAVASAVPIVVNWVNPLDSRYGGGANADG
jgi:hypothetical protein